MLAQAITGTPGHVNAMAESVGHFLERFPVASLDDGDVFLERFPVESLHDGDVLITNDPWKGTGHLNDFTVVTPTFLNGEVVALFAATSHIADVGGLGFGPDANQVFEEGIRIPIGYLLRGGEVNETLIELIRANVRDPDVAEGDLYSLVACNRTGCERLVAMMEEFELVDLERLADFVIDRSREAMLERIGEIRPGRYHYEMRIDGYDREIDLVCTLTVSADGIDVDFDGTSPTSNRGINVPLTYTRAYASFGVRCVVGSEIPNNAGSLDTIRVTAPSGSILNAPDPSAVSARHAVGQMLPDVVLGCLGQALDEPVPAEGASPGAHGRCRARRRTLLRRRRTLRGEPLPHGRHRSEARKGRPLSDRVSFGGEEHPDRNHRDGGSAHLLAEGVHHGLRRAGPTSRRPGASNGDLSRARRPIRHLQDVR